MQFISITSLSLYWVGLFIIEEKGCKNKSSISSLPENWLKIDQPYLWLWKLGKAIGRMEDAAANKVHANLVVPKFCTEKFTKFSSCWLRRWFGRSSWSSSLVGSLCSFVQLNHFLFHSDDEGFGKGLQGRHCHCRSRWCWTWYHLGHQIILK